MTDDREDRLDLAIGLGALEAFAEATEFVCIGCQDLLPMGDLWAVIIADGLVGGVCAECGA